MPAHLAMGVTCIMIEVGVATFSGVHGAEHAYADARDRDPGAGCIGDAVFVEVHRHRRHRGSRHGPQPLRRRGRPGTRPDRTLPPAPSSAPPRASARTVGFAAGLVGGAIAGGAVEASQITEPEGPAFDAIREQVPEGSSAVVVFGDAERIRAMYRALFAAADTFVRHRLSPATEAELRAALAETPVATPPNTLGP
jgi:hypothetical protein